MRRKDAHDMCSTDAAIRQWTDVHGDALARTAQAEKACLLDGMEVPIYGTGRFIRVAMAQGMDGIFVTDEEVDKVHKTVHVGALKQPDESVLREHFKSAGKIMAVKLGKNCAWLEFEHLQAVADALAMDGQKLGDDAAKVTRSKVPIDTAE